MFSLLLILQNKILKMDYLLKTRKFLKGNYLFNDLAESGISFKKLPSYSFYLCPDII